MLGIELTYGFRVHSYLGATLTDYMNRVFLMFCNRPVIGNRVACYHSYKSKGLLIRTKFIVKLYELALIFISLHGEVFPLIVPKHIIC